MSVDQVTARRLKVQVWVYWVQKSLNPREPVRTSFLLLRTQPDRGAFWQPVTGGVEKGETPESAALREAFEETGLAPARPIFQIGAPFEFESRWGPALEFPFGCEVGEHQDRPPEVQLDVREHDQSVWVSAEEALKRLRFESNSMILADLIKKLENQKGE